jgi:hypothetical protein
VTVNLLPLPDLSGFTTVMAPLAAPAGTVAVIEVSLLTVNDEAETPPNFTAVAPRKPLPVIATEVPKVPELGLTRDGLGDG